VGLPGPSGRRRGPSIAPPGAVPALRRAPWRGRAAGRLRRLGRACRRARRRRRGRASRSLATPPRRGRRPRCCRPRSPSRCPLTSR